MEEVVSSTYGVALTCLLVQATYTDLMLYTIPLMLMELVAEMPMVYR